MRSILGRGPSSIRVSGKSVFSSFCVTLLTNPPTKKTNRLKWKHKLFGWIMNCKKCQWKLLFHWQKQPLFRSRTFHSLLASMKWGSTQAICSTLNPTYRTWDQTISSHVKDIHTVASEGEWTGVFCAHDRTEELMYENRRSRRIIVPTELFTKNPKPEQ